MYYCVSLRCTVYHFGIFIYFNGLTIFIYKISLFRYKFPKNLRCLGFQLLTPPFKHRHATKSQFQDLSQEPAQASLSPAWSHPFKQRHTKCVRVHAHTCMSVSYVVPKSVLAWQKPQHENSRRKTGSPGILFLVAISKPSFFSFILLL